MSTPEAKVKRKLDKMLKDEGLWFFSPQAGPYGRAGIPDRLICANGLFAGVECKAGKNKLTALQERCGQEIVRAGGAWFVVYDNEGIESVRAWIRQNKNALQESGNGAEVRQGLSRGQQRKVSSLRQSIPRSKQSST